VFLQIERPASPGAPPEGDQYESIGQFYEAIRLGLSELCSHLGEAAVFTGDPAHQEFEYARIARTGLPLARHPPERLLVVRLRRGTFPQFLRMPYPGEGIDVAALDPARGAAFATKVGVTYPSLTDESGVAILALQGKAPTVPTA